MSRTVKQLEAEARQLSPEQRAELAQRLFASLEGDAGLEPPADAEEAWLSEAERRYQRYLAGDTLATPAAEALARVRERLRNP